jgi:site-specific DNA-adenine methylase
LKLKQKEKSGKEIFLSDLNSELMNLLSKANNDLEEKEKVIRVLDDALKKRAL